MRCVPAWPRLARSSQCSAASCGTHLHASARPTCPCSKEEGGVVFKEGYRSRSYCLSECTQICALEINPPAKAAQAAK